MQTYTFARGEDVAVALDAVSGDMSIVSSISAALKAIPAGRAVLPDAAPVAASFTISPRAASGDVPPGWTLLIPAALSAALPAGNYVADARLNVAGGTTLTSQIGIRLREAVTS